VLDAMHFDVHLCLPFSSWVLIGDLSEKPYLEGFFRRLDYDGISRSNAART
jgi:hypothetical protein